MSDLQTVSAVTLSSSSRSQQGFAVCPIGKTLLSGGARVIRNDNRPWEDVALIESFPVNARSWKAVAVEGTETDLMWQLEVYAICATVN